jgi:hypothetical protein
MRARVGFGVPALMLAGIALAGLGRLEAATLERLSLEDMVLKSTGIVRGRVTGSFVAVHGNIIYTHYRVEVAETWKGGGAAPLDLVVAGGSYGVLRQTFPGSPALAAGGEYVLFVWLSPRTGLNHIVGLTQGMFDIRRGENGELMALRNPTTELMLDAAGRAVRDSAITMRLSELRLRVSATLSQGVRR